MEKLRKIKAKKKAKKREQEEGARTRMAGKRMEYEEAIHRDAVGEPEDEEIEIEDPYEEEPVSRSQVRPAQQEDEDLSQAREGPFDRYFSEAATQQILESAHDPERNITIIWYFLNLLGFVLSMLIFYGLLIILFIIFSIHFYDYTYNYEEFVQTFANSDSGSNLPQELQPFSAGSEFLTSEEMQELEKQDGRHHLGHNHFHLPFNFEHIQTSVWVAILPASLFLWKNMQILKLEIYEEYSYLKLKNGMMTINFIRYLSYFVLCSYLVLLAVNYQVLKKAKGIWQNYEGLTFYSLLCF